jgi:hypothetical protein
VTSNVASIISGFYKILHCVGGKEKQENENTSFYFPYQYYHFFAHT